jgi:peptide/nickel transport system substrate-binding protein
MEMSKDLKELTTREFFELTAIGAAGVAATGMGVPSVFAATPKRGGTVKAGIGFLIQTPDPQRYGGGWARPHMAMLYEGLTTPTSRVERIKTLEEKGPEALSDVQPMLAHSWEIEKGGQRYVFHLEKGVKFHNGKEFDSGDVKWSWERIRDPVHRCHARKLLTLFLESIETPDRYTIVGNLNQPYGGFMIANAWPYTPILPKDCMPHGVIWGFTPTFKPPTPGPPGTGPFKLTKFQQKAEAIFDAHKEYRRKGLPYLDRIIFKVISKPIPRTMAIRAKNIDFSAGVDEKWLAKVLKGKEFYKVINLEKEGLNLSAGAGAMNPFTIYLNNHDKLGNSPFKDERVRKAMDYSLDRERIVKTLYGEMGFPRGQGFDPDVSPWGFEDIGYTKPDIEKAKQLLKEAGYPNGLDVNFSITPTWGKQDLLAQIVQQMAKAAGFRIKIIPEVGVQYWNRLRSMDYHMLHFHMGKEDPQSFYYAHLHTDPAKPYNGYSPALGVKDTVLDILLDDVAKESDFVKRREKFRKVVLRTQEKAYLLPYVSPLGANVWVDKIKNFHPLKYFHTFQAFAEAWLEA